MKTTLHSKWGRAAVRLAALTSQAMTPAGADKVEVPMSAGHGSRWTGNR